jgi:uncharacterized protein Usg
MKDHVETELMLKGYGLTTAEFLYHMPDRPHILQTFLWQHYDIAPRFPALYRFIEFWREKLDGPLSRTRTAGSSRRMNGGASPASWCCTEEKFSPIIVGIDHPPPRIVDGRRFYWRLLTVSPLRRQYCSLERGVADAKFRSLVSDFLRRHRATWRP